MSNDGPLRSVSSQTLLRALAVVLIIALTVAVIGQLRTGAPLDELDLVVPGVEDRGHEPVACTRRLPDQPTVTGELPETVGRVTSADVVDCPDIFDGQVVDVIGEVVGDVLERSGGAWVLLNDDAYALETGPLPAHRDHRGSNSGLSVWLPDELVDLVDRPGGPGVRGTVLALTGVIHRVDPDDGGGLTFRATEGEVLAEATEVPQPVHGPQAIVAVVLSLVAVAVLVVERWTARTR